MNEIKPIETRYNNYRFRSRLEARWAVFFDRLGINYEYEIEGLTLHSNRWLPDFFIPSMGKKGLYVEVKPYFPEYKCLMKLQEFAFSGLDILLISGSPTKQEFFLISKHLLTEDFRCEILMAYFVNAKEFNETQWETVEEYIRDYWIHCNMVTFVFSYLLGSWDLTQVFEIGDYEQKLHSALIKAKQARFEFGESG